MAHPILKVHSTSEFEKSFRKLPIYIQDLAEKKNEWFCKDAFDPRLHTHKLKGELEGYWSYYINRQYRILFQFLNKEADILDISLGLPKEAVSSEIEDDFFVRLDPRTKKVVGFSILNGGDNNGL